MAAALDVLLAASAVSEDWRTGGHRKQLDAILEHG